jgi:hypothetical protein
MSKGRIDVSTGPIADDVIWFSIEALGWDERPVSTHRIWNCEFTPAEAKYVADELYGALYAYEQARAA